MCNMTNKNHEVYLAILGEDKLYIGSGRIGRHKHCTSGISHCYELNRLHFEGANVCVKILASNLSKEDSYELEKKLVLEYKPLYNKAFIKDDRQASARYYYSLSRSIKDTIWQEGIRLRYCHTKELVARVEKFLDKYRVSVVASGIRVNPRELRLLYNHYKPGKREEVILSAFNIDWPFIKVADKLLMETHES